MAWIKSNITPLAVGAILGYFVAKSGGLRGSLARAKGAVS